MKGPMPPCGASITGARRGAFVMAFALSGLGAALYAAGCGGDDDGPSGGAGVEVPVTLCPAITSYTVDQVRIAANDPVRIRGTAEAPDAAALKYGWTASAGRIDDPHAAATFFSCDAPGKVTLTFTASDGSCKDTADVQVECVGGGTPDGGADASGVDASVADAAAKETSIGAGGSG